ncbi:hypothetical protein GS416_05485 [Rhodococcus hoagii]|nr:hypothetical protein [Prescottella equi]
MADVAAGPEVVDREVCDVEAAVGVDDEGEMVATVVMALLGGRGARRVPGAGGRLVLDAVVDGDGGGVAST